MPKHATNRGWIRWLGLLGGLLLLGVGCGSGGAASDGHVKCVQLEDCGGRAVCLDGECVALCLGDADCQAPAVHCDSTSHLCVACVSNEHCAAEEYCSSGKCAADVCVPGEASCDPVTHAERVCQASGGDYDVTRCASRTSCVLENGQTSCRDWACTPAAPHCDAAGAVLSACSADGLAASVTDCLAEGKRCVAGACVEVVCEPGARRCEGGASYLCNPLGSASVLERSCVEIEYCDETTGSCRLDLCDAGTPHCSGTFATVCAADGSGPAPGGVDCALSAGMTCAKGKCRAVVCTPNQDFCNTQGNAVAHCDASGANPSDVQTCAVTSHCDPDTLTCVSDLCVEGSAACDGETLAECNLDGSGFDSRGEDCSLSSRVCSFAGACVDADVSTVGWLDRQFPGDHYLVANFYRVTVARTLTRIEEFASANASTELAWFVYEGDSQDAELSLVMQSTTQGSADEFQSSGAVSVPLRADRYYWVGVRALGEMTFYRGDNIMSTPLHLSFGDWLGGGNSVEYAALPSTMLGGGGDPRPYYQRLTTQAP